MSCTHFTLIERGKLEGFLALKMNIREIAKIMGRHHSTIAREIKRNNDNFYYAATAHQNASDRKAKASSRTKLPAELIAIIEDKLFSTWSPEQIERGIFSNGVSISERSEHANNRTEFGHWELDSMVSGRGESKGVFSTFIERKSRLYTAFVGKDRTANTMEQAIRKLYEALPKGAFKSATSDRGKEFACHTIIKEDLKIDFYFANAYAPWRQKNYWVKQ